MMINKTNLRFYNTQKKIGFQSATKPQELSRRALEEATKSLIFDLEDNILDKDYKVRIFPDKNNGFNSVIANEKGRRKAMLMPHLQTIVLEGKGKTPHESVESLESRFFDNFSKCAALVDVAPEK